MKTKNIFLFFAGWLAFAVPVFYAQADLKNAEKQEVHIADYEKQKWRTCHKIYGDIYNDDIYISDCEELSYENISELQDVYETLKNPINVYNDYNVYDRFYDKYSSDFLYNLRLFLDISPEPLSRLTEDYNSWEARKMLAWIAESEKMAKVIYEFDSDFEILGSLFENSGLLVNGDWLFRNLIRGGKGFFDLITKNDNETAFNYVHTFLLSKPECHNNPELCFKNYCAAIDSFNFKITNMKTTSRLLNYENLETYLDGVIANKINKANWRYQDLEDSADLSNDWWGDLCPARKQSDVRNKSKIIWEKKVVRSL